jgi:hypothetical protein
MLFTKEFLVEKFEEKIDGEVLKSHPFITNDQPGEVSDGKAELMTYHQYFDLRSEDAKNAMYNARQEALNTCFEDKDMGVYPNSEKIKNCIENAKMKNFGKFEENRILYFANCKIFF